MNTCERFFCRSQTCVSQVLIGVALKKGNTLIFALFLAKYGELQITMELTHTRVMVVLYHYSFLFCRKEEHNKQWNILFYRLSRRFWRL